MPEIRRNLATKEWVIVPTENSVPPQEFIAQGDRTPQVAPQDCPFCPGNESRTPPETLAYRSFGSKANESGWWVRIVPDKEQGMLSPNGEMKRDGVDHFFQHFSAVGHHEIIIETPNHSESFGHMDQKQIEELFLAYRERYLSLKRGSRIQMITFFKNHGPLAGGQIEHCHSHMLALPVVPLRIRHHQEEARRYYEDKDNCVYCDMIEAERAAGERVIVENEQFIAFMPYASLTPFEIWVVLKDHQSSFDQAHTGEVKQMGHVVNEVFRRINKALNAPDYNYYLFSAPFGEQSVAYYHWYLQIVPRLRSRSRYDLGSGIHLNPVLPKDAAKLLREA